ncbi:sel1 repeat family protein [Acinetobacter indicus]|uniref:tetratricopeptide repeat protein n=2 Tax=Acinetobacter indicus TaxID=756892 RepID=UPI000CECA3B8|nr:tetratricopeptide repeat protein [Acinetobacter indicus]QIZ60935.1 sel1 repeat family protein [Acinetobacter indicus]
MRFFLGLFFLFFGGSIFAGCIKIDNKIASEVFVLSLYNLQGNQKEVTRKISEMNANYYKNYYYGYSYLIGKNNLRNYELAENYLLKSAEYCFSPAYYSLGYLYYKNGNIEKAKEMYKKAKKMGDNLASHQLALIYKDEGNKSKMMEYLLYAEKNDFLPSITELGVQFYDGILISKDLDKAFFYFEKAAMKNDSLAQNNIGWMYEHGEGTSKNLEKALYWYKMAYENGFYLGEENLKRLENRVKLEY